ncbi:AEC family transporter [Modestobacter lapidis]|nr:AEC family transporter [Modestobacter lapidis]
MSGVLSGFSVIGAVIAVGYLLARSGTLGPHAPAVLSRVAFSVATPALLFTTLAAADLSVVFSRTLVVISGAALLSAALFAAVGAVRRWGVGTTTIGALGASQVNAANLGIPIAVYVLGDAGAVAPVLLFQLVLLVPVALTVLDVTVADGTGTRWSRVWTPFRNPVLVGSVAGLVVSGTGWSLPPLLLDPVGVIGGLAVPAVLLAYGMSLRGSPWPGRGPDRGPVLLAVALKLLLAPTAAWLLGTGLGLDRDGLLVVVVLSALPAAQNLLVFAVTYRTGVDLARETITLSTVLSVPVLFVVAALLG